MHRRIALLGLTLAACGSHGIPSDAALPPDATVPAVLDDGGAPDLGQDANLDASAGAYDDDGDGAMDASSDASDASDASLDQSVPACPPEMVHIEGYCIDRYEAHVVEVLPDGGARPHSPYLVVDGLTVRAESAGGVVPQGYISQVQAAAACQRAGKRLCSADEFRRACRGPDAADLYPYGGTTRVLGACNEGKGSSLPRYYGSDASKWTYAAFNDPRLNQWDGGLAPTGSYPRCVSPDGVYDCVGNLHEWGSDAPDAKGHGRFRGGFYGDAEVNGHGCAYVTSAHELAYHDYSTGFRCCMDPND